VYTSVHQCTLPDDGVRRLKLVGVNTATFKLRQFVIPNKIRQTEIPALRDSWATKAPSVKMLCKQTICFSLYFRNNITCFSVGLLIICQVFPSPVEVWVMAHCCFMSNICATHIELWRCWFYQWKWIPLHGTDNVKKRFHQLKPSEQVFTIGSITVQQQKVTVASSTAGHACLISTTASLSSCCYVHFLRIVTSK
jgi:hypothetical protein